MYLLLILLAIVLLVLILGGIGYGRRASSSGPQTTIIEDD